MSPALEQQVSHLRDRSDVVAEFRIAGSFRRLPAETELALFRIDPTTRTWQRKMLTPNGAGRTLVCPATGTLIAGTTGGVLRSTDHGDTWRSGQGLAYREIVVAMAVAPTGALYAAAQKHLYRSDDDGRTWQVAASLAAFLHVFSVAVHPNGDIFVGTLDFGIQKLPAGSSTWEAVNTRQQAGVISSLFESRSGRLMAGSYTGLFYSDDGAATWSRVDLNPPSQGYTYIVEASDGTSARRVLEDRMTDLSLVLLDDQLLLRALDHGHGEPARLVAALPADEGKAHRAA